jgi:hypothetical protein
MEEGSWDWELLLGALERCWNTEHTVPPAPCPCPPPPPHPTPTSAWPTRRHGARRTAHGARRTAHGARRTAHRTAHSSAGRESSRMMDDGGE